MKRNAIIIFAMLAIPAVAQFGGDAASIMPFLRARETRIVPVAHYPLDGNALDVSGNDRHGTEVNMTYESGLDGQVGKFTGSVSKVIAEGAAGAMAQSAGTITMWTRPEFDFDDGLNHLLWDTYGGSNRRFYLFKKGGDGKTEVATDNTARGDHTVQWQSNTWHHVAFVWGDNKLYIDGSLVHTYSAGGLGDGSSDLYIADRFGTVSNVGWKGNVARVIVYNVALSAANIARVKDGKDAIEELQ